MSETTLVFVFVMAIGSLGLTMGLQALLWSTRNASASSGRPLAFAGRQAFGPRPGMYVKPVPSVPVRVRRVWREERLL